MDIGRYEHNSGRSIESSIPATSQVESQHSAIIERNQQWHNLFSEMWSSIHSTLRLSTPQYNNVYKYVSWGRCWGLEGNDLFPASEQVLVLFVTWLARTISYPAIKAYLNSVIAAHESGGLFDTKDRIKKMRTLQVLKKSLKTSLGNRSNVRRKQALTEHQMGQLGQLQAKIWHQQDNDDWHCALVIFILSFWSGLRADNTVLTSNHNKYDPHRHLNYGALKFNKAVIEGTLDKHKTMAKMAKL